MAEIHRCRFVDYPPSTINALAFSHSYASKRETKFKNYTLRLAIGRANGDIEIWNPLSGAWLQETLIKGAKDRSIDNLAWIQDPDDGDIKGRLRLFSTGYASIVTEWDLEKGQPKRIATGNHGDILCLAASPENQCLAAGTNDGAIVLYSTKDDEITMERVVARASTKKAVFISVAWQSKHIVVAGGTDSIIRVFDIRKGTLIRAMSLGQVQGGPKEIFVWAVKVLPDGTIVSGDSSGELRLWDGKTYTLMQRIKSHRQDILSLAVSADGNSIFSGGMDRRTTVYKQAGERGRSRWAEVSHQRYHSHDVKAMATYEGKGLSVVVSGGPDATPVVVPLAGFGLENQRALSFLPHQPIVKSAPKKRLIMSWWEREVYIHRLSKTKLVPESIESENEYEQRPRDRKLVAKILVKGEANITSATISADGSMLAIATVLGIKLFRLKPRPADEGESLKVTKVDLHSNLAESGARLIEFSPNGKWLLVVKNDSRIVMARLTGSGKTLEVLPSLSKLERIDRHIEKKVLIGGLGSYDRNINRVAFSSDSRIVAVSDLAGFIDTFVLEGDEDLQENGIQDHISISSDSDSSDDESEEKRPITIFGQHWERNQAGSLIPQLPSPLVVLSFRPSTGKLNETNGLTLHATRNNPHPISHHMPHGEDRLLVVTAGAIGNYSKVLEFNVLQGSLSAWSKRNPIANFPEEYRGLRDQAMGCVWDVKTDQERIWVYGTSWLWMFDLSRDLPLYEAMANGTNGHSSETEMPNGSLQSRKRRRSQVGPAEWEMRKGVSGAGNKIPDHENTSGMSRKMQRFMVDETNESKQILREDQMDVDDDDEGEGDDEMALGVSRGARQLVQRGNSADSNFWCTYKYRPILGITPMGDEDEAFEMVIVERPLEEADLPARYYGDQEWQKQGVDL